MTARSRRLLLLVGDMVTFTVDGTALDTEATADADGYASLTAH